MRMIEGESEQILFTKPKCTRNSNKTNGKYREKQNDDRKKVDKKQEREGKKKDSKQIEKAMQIGWVRREWAKSAVNGVAVSIAIAIPINIT